MRGRLGFGFDVVQEGVDFVSRFGVVLVVDLLRDERALSARLVNNAFGGGDQFAGRFGIGVRPLDDLMTAAVGTNEASHRTFMCCRWRPGGAHTPRRSWLSMWVGWLHWPLARAKRPTKAAWDILPMPLRASINVSPLAKRIWISEH